MSGSTVVSQTRRWFHVEMSTPRMIFDDPRDAAAFHDKAQGELEAAVAARVTLLEPAVEGLAQTFGLAASDAEPTSRRPWRWSCPTHGAGGLGYVTLRFDSVPPAPHLHALQRWLTDLLRMPVPPPASGPEALLRRLRGEPAHPLALPDPPAWPVPAPAPWPEEQARAVAGAWLGPLDEAVSKALRGLDASTVAAAERIFIRDEMSWHRGIAMLLYGAHERVMVVTLPHPPDDELQTLADPYDTPGVFGGAQDDVYQRLHDVAMEALCGWLADVCDTVGGLPTTLSFSRYRSGSTFCLDERRWLPG